LNATTSPTVGTTLSAARSSAHDGMSCVDAPPPFVGGPGLTISKVASSDTNVPVGDTVTYTYTVTNVGMVNINDVTISDLHGGAGSLGPISLGWERSRITQAVPVTIPLTMIGMCLLLQIL